MTQLHDRIATVTERIRSRSHDRRQAYLEDIAAMEESPDSDRRAVSCSNMAHAAAAAGPDQDSVLGTGGELAPNIGIITAYNDMLSAHQPFERYPQVIRAAARAAAPAEDEDACDGGGLSSSYDGAAPPRERES